MYEVSLNWFPATISKRYLKDAKAAAIAEAETWGYEDAHIEITKGRVTYQSEDGGKTWFRFEFVKRAS